MLCPSCGIDNRGDARYCRACGASLSVMAPAPPNPLQAPAPPVLHFSPSGAADETFLGGTTGEPEDLPLQVDEPEYMDTTTEEGPMPDAEMTTQHLTPEATPGARASEASAPSSQGTPPAVDPAASPAGELPAGVTENSNAVPAGGAMPAPAASLTGESGPLAPAQTPFGEPPSSPQTGPLSPGAVVAAPEDAHPDLAGPPLDGRATAKLAESDAVSVAAPVPGEDFPALQVGSVVANRYTIQQVLQTGPQRQMYLAGDQAGYQRCWACGSQDNVQGELYCTNCGAQLTGKTYRLLETPPEAPLPAIPAPLRENLHTGVAGIFDQTTDPATGRHYLVLEDVGGQPLATLLPPGEGEEVPTPGRLLNWVSTAAETLRELHAARVVGCDFTPQALQVLPGDRLVLADPTACRVAGTAGDNRPAQAETQADVQRVAAVIEQWYEALRPGPAVDPPAEPSAVAAVLARAREGGYPTAAAFADAIRDLTAAATGPGNLQLASGRASDVGVQRKLNEDSLFTLECVIMESAGATPTGVYVVADGMGGHDSGEVASSIAVRTIGSMLTGVIDARITGEGVETDPDATADLLRRAILEANRRISRLSEERHSDMGTTVTMAVVVGTQVTVANVGDSRTYLWRDSKLHQISQDHSLVARLIAAGQLTPEEGRTYDRRNEIYRALGDPHLTADEVDVFHVTLRARDGLVLCSDGLWEMVRDEDIEQILLDAPDLSMGAQRLIEAANRNGGADNITVIIAQTLTSSEETDA